MKAYTIFNVRIRWRNVRESETEKPVEQVKNIITVFIFELSQLHICGRNDLRNIRHKRGI